MHLVGLLLWCLRCTPFLCFSYSTRQNEWTY